MKMKSKRKLKRKLEPVGLSGYVYGSRFGSVEFVNNNSDLVMCLTKLVRGHGAIRGYCMGDIFSSFLG